MEYSILKFVITNFINGLFGMMLLLIGYFILNILTPGKNLHYVFREQEVTNSGIIISSFFISTAIIIAFTAG